jgi:hypothetical protein
LDVVCETPSLLCSLTDGQNNNNNDDDDDTGPLYDKEATALLNHVERFLELFERGNYRDASYIAACSPRGVLRNMETLCKFKGTDVVVPRARSSTETQAHRCSLFAVQA